MYINEIEKRRTKGVEQISELRGLQRGTLNEQYMEWVVAENLKEYMRYAIYREQGLFIDSGVVEAGCKHLLGQRLKQSGMEWTVWGANATLALRSVILSNRCGEYWEQRTA